jgi:hypothetical protein
MILPAALALGAQLIMPVADGVPQLNVEQVCEGIAQQGGTPPSPKRRSAASKASRPSATNSSSNGRVLHPPIRLLV